MLRFSYEWSEPHSDDHWSDELYAIYDAKVGFTDPFAWTWTRDDAERIVDALNLVEGNRQSAEYIVARCIEIDNNDLSDLLD